MDNYISNGTSVNEDIFGFIPPDMMYADSASSKFSSKEEKERYEYQREHSDELHIEVDPKQEAEKIKDQPPINKTF